MLILLLKFLRIFPGGDYQSQLRTFKGQGGQTKTAYLLFECTFYFIFWSVEDRALVNSSFKV